MADELIIPVSSEIVYIGKEGALIALVVGDSEPTFCLIVPMVAEGAD